MNDRPNPTGRPAPLGRLPTRSFRKSGPIAKPAPLPTAPTPAATSVPQPQMSRSGRVPQPVPADGPIDHDIACGVLAGIFDAGPHTVLPDTLTVVNPTDRSQKVYRDWVRPNDVIGALTRMYLAAKVSLDTAPVLPANAPPGQRTQQQLARDEAVARHQELKKQIYDVLRFRDALERAQRKGFRLLFTPPETPSGAVRRTAR